jgi:hypothetical protein
MSDSPTYAARIIAIPFRPETVDQVINIYRTTSVPLTLESLGLKTMLGFVNRATGDSASITVWETPADRERSGMTPTAAENLMQYAPLMQGSYRRDIYDATVHTLRHADTEQPYARAVGRITTLDFESERWDTTIGPLRALAGAVTPEHPNCFGAMLFEQRSRGRALLIEVAASPDALLLFEQRVSPSLYGSHIRSALIAPPQREVFDVMAWF